MRVAPARTQSGMTMRLTNRKARKLVTFVVIVPAPDAMHLFFKPPGEPLRKAAQFEHLEHLWRHLPSHSALYVIVLAGGDLLTAMGQIVGDYYDVIHVPSRWFQHLPRAAHFRRAAWALRLAATYRIAPLQERFRRMSYVDYW